MSGLTGNYGNTSGDASKLDTTGLMGGLDGLRQSIDALNKNISPTGADGQGAEGEDITSFDTTFIETMNAAVRDTTRDLLDFRQKLGALITDDDGSGDGSAGAGTDLLASLLGGGESEASEDGEEALTPDEKMAKTQELAETEVAIEEDKATKKKVAKKKETTDDKMKHDKGLTMATAAANKLGILEKETAIASTIINTAQAIGEANPNIPMMVMAAATGAAQLGVIKGQFHGGIDEVPDSGTYLLEKGERVVDKRLNADLKGYLGGQGGGSVSNKAGDNVSIANTVTMQFSEGTTEDQVTQAREQFKDMLTDLYDEHAIRSPFDGQY